MGPFAGPKNSLTECLPPQKRTTPPTTMTTDKHAMTIAHRNFRPDELIKCSNVVFTGDKRNTLKPHYNATRYRADLDKSKEATLHFQ